jgi:hypothetical protein
LAAEVRARIGFERTDAQTRWTPRLAHFAEATLATELEAIRRGMVGSTLVWVPFLSLETMLRDIRRADLAVTVVGSAPDPLAPVAPSAPPAEWDPREVAVYGLLVSREARSGIREDELAVEFATASTLRDCGFPPCCAHAWAAALKDGWRDPIALALSRDDAELPALAALASLGLGPLRHAPCSATCAATRGSVACFCALAREIGFGEQAALWEEMQALTARATVRSRIVDVKTAEFRFAYRATGRVTAQPAPAASPPKSYKRWYALPAFASPEPEAADSQFTDEFARRSRWSTVVWEQSSLLARVQGAVLHLDCGDGLLLELIQLMRPSRQAAGIDPNPALLDRASSRFGQAAVRLARGDWTGQADVLSTFRESAEIIFLDPERLADAPVPERLVLLDRLASMRAQAMVIVATDRALSRFGDIERLASAAGVRIGQGRSRRVSATIEGFLS